MKITADFYHKEKVHYEKETLLGETEDLLYL